VLSAGLVALHAPAYAQGRATGLVRDEAGQGLKGATVVAENPNATPKSFTTTTDDRGRFSMIGLSSGIWTLTASAPGFVPSQTAAQISVARPNNPLEFKLARGAAGSPSALAGLNLRELQNELQAAEALFQAGKWDEALAAYKTIMAKAEFLTTINLQIGHIYRVKKEYDRAMAAYQEVLKADPQNARAKVAIEETSKAQAGR
jgi:uncharacterized GH25 family protein